MKANLPHLSVPLRYTGKENIHSAGYSRYPNARTFSCLYTEKGRTHIQYTKLANSGEFCYTTDTMLKKKTIVSAYLTLTPEHKTYLRTKLRGLTLRVCHTPLSQETLDKETNILVVFVDSPVSKKIIDALPKLQLIVTLSTGYDHIDIGYAKKKHIPVCNVPNYGEHTVAEYTIALMLCLSRQMFPAIKRVKEGNFDYHGLCGMDLKDKTVGIIGTGKIGIHTIRMLQGFHTNIVAFDTMPKKELQQEYRFRYVSLSQLLKQSDIISLHVPLFDSTYHLIDKKAIKKMKPGVILINTARGALIDSEALLYGLNNKIVAGAGLDVLEGEDVMQDSIKLLSQHSAEETRVSLINNVLVDHPQVLVTPHNAFNSQEAIQRILDTGIENIHSYLAHSPSNMVLS